MAIEVVNYNMDKFINYIIRKFYRIVNIVDVEYRVIGRVGLCMGGILGGWVLGVFGHVIIIFGVLVGWGVDFGYYIWEGENFVWGELVIWWFGY
jgi:hypothetical protein